jgi:fructuronate reductase
VALVDPLADELARIGLATTGDAAADADIFLGMESVFGPLAREPQFIAAMHEAMATLADGSPAAVAGALARYSR